MWKSLLSIAAAALALATAAPASAYHFKITSAEYQVGSGYGVEASEDSSTATLFNARFDATLQNWEFDLNTVGSFAGTFAGQVTFDETTISPGEQDNLGVTVVFNFASPLSEVVQAIAVVGTVLGPSRDNTLGYGNTDESVADWTIDFSPVYITFGYDGVFRIDLGDMIFTDLANHIPQAVSVTLIHAIPEPATLALLGLGLIGLGAMRRRRAV